ncbi:expressed unknown protein [Seminavis robusta]|uniref:Uncharacterized protein n=1 Tax=Seminavis robusta TaxID=568900 RepID=A0A9N8HN50_9STRA|nr:expressed unknown protein [Seminavis robusta]|eukprot:Sro795_g203570.1 n/a (380) ;mRNA; f:34885-36024
MTDPSSCCDNSDSNKDPPEEWTVTTMIMTVATSLEDDSPMEINLAETLERKKNPPKQPSNDNAYWFPSSFCLNTDTFRKQQLAPILLKACQRAGWQAMIKGWDKSRMATKVVCRRHCWYKNRSVRPDYPKKTRVIHRPMPGKEVNCPFKFLVGWDPVQQRWFLPKEQRGCKRHVGHGPQQEENINDNDKNNHVQEQQEGKTAKKKSDNDNQPKQEPPGGTSEEDSNDNKREATDDDKKQSPIFVVETNATADHDKKTDNHTISSVQLLQEQEQQESNTTTKPPPATTKRKRVNTLAYNSLLPVFQQMTDSVQNSRELKHLAELMHQTHRKLLEYQQDPAQSAVMSRGNANDTTASADSGTAIGTDTTKEPTSNKRQRQE